MKFPIQNISFVGVSRRSRDVYSRAATKSLRPSRKQVSSHRAQVSSQVASHRVQVSSQVASHRVQVASQVSSHRAKFQVTSQVPKLLDRFFFLSVCQIISVSVNQNVQITLILISVFISKKINHWLIVLLVQTITLQKY
jgi:hypothetical protein